MRKQVARGFTMLMFAVALAFVTAGSSANGQTINARARVPFDFIVGTETLKAGAYNVTSLTSGGEIIRVRDQAGKVSAARQTIPASTTSRDCKLVFHRYGQFYFLAEVWSGAGASGRQLMKSKQERSLEKESAKIASVSGPAARQPYEMVVIAASLH